MFDYAYAHNASGNSPLLIVKHPPYYGPDSSDSLKQPYKVTQSHSRQKYQDIGHQDSVFYVSSQNQDKGSSRNVEQSNITSKYKDKMDSNIRKINKKVRHSIVKYGMNTLDGLDRAYGDLLNDILQLEFRVLRDLDIHSISDLICDNELRESFNEFSRNEVLFSDHAILESLFDRSPRVDTSVNNTFDILLAKLENILYNSRNTSGSNHLLRPRSLVMYAIAHQLINHSIRIHNAFYGLKRTDGSAIGKEDATALSKLLTHEVAILRLLSSLIARVNFVTEPNACQDDPNMRNNQILNNFEKQVLGVLQELQKTLVSIDRGQNTQDVIAWLRIKPRARRDTLSIRELYSSKPVDNVKSVSFKNR